MKQKIKILIVVSALLTISIAILGVIKLKEANTNHKIQEIKNELGHGSNGDITNIEEGINDEGNRTYTITYKDDEIKVITIRPINESDSINTDETSDNSGDSSTVDINDVDKQEEPGTSFEKYNLLTVKEKEAFIDSFDTSEEFYAWYGKAKEEYDSLHVAIEVNNNEVVDLSNKQ